MRTTKKGGRPGPPACSIRSRHSTRCWPVITPAALGLGPVDAVQEHGQLRGTQGHARLVRAHGRPAKRPLLQSLVDDDEAVLIPVEPVEQLDAVATLVAEDEDVPGERVVVQVLPHLLSQAVEALAEID